MVLRFRSLLSGSSGNAAMVWDDTTRLLVDCGPRSQKACRKLLADHASGRPPLSGVIVSHLHTDHICYSSLRVLEAEGVPVYVHADNREGLSRRFNGRPFADLRIREFGDEPFTVGGVTVHPTGVEHAPDFTTHAFRISSGETVVVVATDLWSWDGAVERFADADLLFIESNYDPELLELFPNLNSEFHLENSRAGELIAEVARAGRRAPRAVVLAHLSEQRNRPRLARTAVAKVLKRAGLGDVPLHVAPRHKPSREFVLGKERCP